MCDHDQNSYPNLCYTGNHRTSATASLVASVTGEARWWRSGLSASGVCPQRVVKEDSVGVCRTEDLGNRGERVRSRLLLLEVYCIAL